MPSLSTSARGSRRWDLGDVAADGRSGAVGHRVIGYPALLDDDDSVSLRIVTNPDLQQRGDARRSAPAVAAHRRAVGG